MKNSKKIILTVTFILSALLFFNEKSYSDFFFMAHMATPLPGLSITYETFHSDLEPAGEWIPVSRAEIIPDNEEEIEAACLKATVTLGLAGKDLGLPLVVEVQASGPRVSMAFLRSAVSAFRS